MTERRRNPQDIINWTGGFIVVGLIAILFFVTYALIFRSVPETNQNALLVLIGILSTNITNVVQWFYGGSSTSKKQADTIDTLAKSAAAPPASPDALVIAPGTSATATATPGGTVITTDKETP